MRRWLPFLFALLLAACSGSDETTTVADTPDEADVTTEASGEVTFTSVPVADLSADHVNPPVSFDTSPSTGGAHYPFWMNCGFWTVEVLEGAATHTMEHGAVWITYNADRVTADELSELEALARSDSKLLITPYDHPEKLVLSAWGVQHRQDDLRPGDAAVAEFIESWKDNPELPEAGVTCQDALGFPPDNVRTLVSNGEVLDDSWQ